MISLKFSEVESNNVLPISDYRLTGRQNYVLLRLIDMVSQNPAIFFSDYLDYTREEIDAFCDETIEAIMTGETPPLQYILPLTKFTPENYISKNGGDVSWTSYTPNYGSGFWQQATPTINDRIDYPNVYLPAGLYTIRCFYNQLTDGGIVKFRLGGSTVLTIDTYGTFTANRNGFASDIELDAGIYTFDHIVDSKNASSAGYKFQMLWCYLWGQYS